VCKVHSLSSVRTSDERLRRIRQEAILLSYMDHVRLPETRAASSETLIPQPNVISMKSAFETQNTLLALLVTYYNVQYMLIVARYIFTELATGGDLFSLLKRCEYFTDIEIRWILLQVLRGVSDPNVLAFHTGEQFSQNSYSALERRTSADIRVAGLYAQKGRCA